MQPLTPDRTITFCFVSLPLARRHRHVSASVIICSVGVQAAVAPALAVRGWRLLLLLLHPGVRAAQRRQHVRRLLVLRCMVVTRPPLPLLPCAYIIDIGSGLRRI